MLIHFSPTYVCLFGLGLAMLDAPAAAQRPHPCVPVRPTHHFAAQTPDLPPPPATALGEFPVGYVPAVPAVDSGLPQPNSAESTVTTPGSRVGLTGQFKIFESNLMIPKGVTPTNPGSPAVADAGGVLFGVGNTYAALSTNHGRDWSYINPYTRFPNVDGGVCCDQRVVYVPRHDITIWLLRYRYGSRTRTGGLRIAVARSRDDLINSRWSSYYFSTKHFSRLRFGGNEQWFDWPDIAVTRDNLYLASNVHSGTSGAWLNAIVARTSLVSLARGTTVGFRYYLSVEAGGMGGTSYRLTQTNGQAPPTTMYWACHSTTSGVRIFQWSDQFSARRADVTRAIPTWAAGPGSSPGPDGRDWIGSDDHRITGGFFSSATEAGFLWGSRHNGSSRPQSYVRVCLFRPSDRTVYATRDIWNSAVDLAYPAVGVNALGHKGVVVAMGSATRHVTSAAFLVDNYQSIWGQWLRPLGVGTDGAPSNAWGRSFAVVGSASAANTFQAVGMWQDGGPRPQFTKHRAVWFGRDDYTPPHVRLYVQSTGLTAGGTVSVRDKDIYGASSGPTPFRRYYYRGQPCRLEAPKVLMPGQVAYAFRDWTGAVQSSRQILEVPSLTANASVWANYQPAVQLSVSSNAAPHIVVSRQDIRGSASATAPFRRDYLSGSVQVTAPATAVRGSATLNFYRWMHNGFPEPVGQRGLSLAMTEVRSVRALYGTYDQPSATGRGVGCRGSAGIPGHSVTGTPVPGASVTFRAAPLPAGALTLLAIGRSDTTWNGLPLPIDLAFLGAPGCRVFVSLDVLVSVPNPSGSPSMTVALPLDASNIGVSLFSQVLGRDVPANALGFVVSNYVETKIGGWRIP